MILFDIIISFYDLNFILKSFFKMTEIEIIKILGRTSKTNVIRLKILTQTYLLAPYKDT